MRQILYNSSGVIVARMPRPIAEPGHVLVRVHHSLISVGTEIAALRPPGAPAAAATPAEKALHYSELARLYLGLAARNPGKAVRRVGQIARRAVRQVIPQRSQARPAVEIGFGDLRWEGGAATSISELNGELDITTDRTAGAYQVLSFPVEVPDGLQPIVIINGQVVSGEVCIGILNDTRERWLGNRVYDAGRIDDRLIFAAEGSTQITIVIANSTASAASRVVLEAVEVSLVDPELDGLPASELEDQGWNLGYSAAGEVIEVGAGVNEFAVGDLVACAGAGKANHADYVSVPKNLVARIPTGCDPRWAASTTVGTIALQGVRRARPELGERVCVIGLGLLGQLTAQMLTANGCRVIGHDLDAARVERATALGLAHGSADPDAIRALVRDVTGARGADCTLITAATKSDAVINLAMELTRAKGKVVIVGDIGIRIDRAVFYRKEIDLLMSTSYGPGRYDRNYEEAGHDYPYAYVRWTLNRNMQAYMDLIAAGRLNVEALIDRIVPIDEAPAAYRELVAAGSDVPLGVLLAYPDDERRLPEPAAATRIAVRGHRTPPDGVLRYALVGAGAFGMAMLVPKMAERKDRFFLRGIVSRNNVQAGNFARANQVEIMTTDLDEVLNDADIDLVVIATRHAEHAEQVTRSLRAGKHVFVEKPLALSWEELDQIAVTYADLDSGVQLMVGFNRRFSPAITRLREQLGGRRSPLVISYRLNGGYIAPDHWIQDAQGGGRNLGEACHMYDVFRALTGARAVNVTARSIDPQGAPFLRNDNFAATIGYADGSLANLVYTAVGPRQGMSKERIEVFADGEAYIIDDYKRLTRASDGEVLWQAAEPDKGHAIELAAFGDAIANATQTPIPFDEILETTAVALHVEELLMGKYADNE